MKTFLTLVLLTFSASGFTSVVKSYDTEHSCDLYKVVPETFTITDETIIFPKAIYGFSFENLEIDFDHREAKVQIMMNVVLGLNRPIVDEKSHLLADNPNFGILINKLNRKVMLLNRICLSADNKIIYGN